MIIVSCDDEKARARERERDGCGCGHPKKKKLESLNLGNMIDHPTQAKKWTNAIQHGDPNWGLHLSRVNYLVHAFQCAELRECPLV